jgi:hypothetical protein
MTVRSPSLSGSRHAPHTVRGWNSAPQVWPKSIGSAPGWVAVAVAPLLGGVEDEVELVACLDRQILVSQRPLLVGATLEQAGLFEPLPQRGPGAAAVHHRPRRPSYAAQRPALECKALQAPGTLAEVIDFEGPPFMVGLDGWERIADTTLQWALEHSRDRAATWARGPEPASLRLSRAASSWSSPPEPSACPPHRPTHACQADRRRACARTAEQRVSASRLRRRVPGETASPVAALVCVNELRPRIASWRSCYGT